MFLKKAFLIISFGITIAFPVFAQTGDYGLTVTADAAKLTKITSLPTLFGNVLGTALSLIGIIFFALMLYGGIVWMVARGNAENEKKALGTITSAIIGILIVLGSYAITNFVFKSVGQGEGSTATEVVSKKCVYDLVVTTAYCQQASCPATASVCDNKIIVGGVELCGAKAVQSSTLCVSAITESTCPTTTCAWK